VGNFWRFFVPHWGFSQISEMIGGGLLPKFFNYLTYKHNFWGVIEKGVLNKRGGGFFILWGQTEIFRVKTFFFPPEKFWWGCFSTKGIIFGERTFSRAKVFFWGICGSREPL